MFSLLQICTLLTQKALEDVKRCKDPASVAAGKKIHTIKDNLHLHTTQLTTNVGKTLAQRYIFLVVKTL